MPRTHHPGPGVALTVALVAAALQFSGSVDQPAASAPALDVAVQLRETAGVSRAGELVTFGVPLAEERAITDTGQLQVTTDAGQVVPAQFMVTGRWGGSPEDSSLPIRWVLVDALIDIAAHESATLHLITAQHAGGPGMAVTDEGDALVVDTGKGRFSVPTGSGHLVDSALIDGTELIDTDDTLNGIVLTTPAGERLTTAEDATVLATEVTEHGPVKTVLHQTLEFDDNRLKDEAAETWGPNACFTWHYPCDELRKYRVRVDVWLTFVTGSGAVRARTRVANTSVCPVTEDGAKHCWLEHSLNSTRWSDMSLHLGLAEPADSFFTGPVTDETTAPVVSYQDSSGTDQWDYFNDLAPVGDGGYTPGGWEDRSGSHVSFRGFETTSGDGIIDQGDRMPGWLAVSGGSGAAAVSVADAWKNYPLALRAQQGGDALEIGLYPGEFAADFSLRPGEGKTHELALWFGTNMDRSSVIGSQAWIDEPIRWSWDPAYGVETGALPGLTTVGLEPDYDLWNRASVDVSVSNEHNPNTWYENQSLLVSRDSSNHWGKKEAGYLPNDNEADTSTDLSKYRQYQGFLYQALRNAGYDYALADTWWDLAVDANRAQADSGYLILPYATPTSVWRGINIAHCFHDNNENRTYPRGGGFGCDFVGDLGGMTDLYHLTGWEPALDAISYHAENVRLRAQDESSFGLEARQFASYIDVLVDAWEFSGDDAYLDAALNLLDAMAADDGMKYLRCPCSDTGSLRINSLFAGWLLEALGRLADAELARSGTTGASYQRVRDVLAEHAEWFSEEVAFSTTLDGVTEWVTPYYWYLDGRSSNTEPVSAGYQLMAIDGLAAAARHSANSAYLQTADALFGTVMKMPFFFGDWPQFVYSTINDAGKLATFGGTFINELHRGTEPPPPPTSSTTTTTVVTPPPPPTVDKVALRMEGHLHISLQGRLDTGGFDISRDTLGVATVVGSGTLAGDGGPTIVKAVVARLWILPVYLGTVTVDAPTSPAVTVLVWLGRIESSGDTVTLSALYPDLNGSPPRWGTLMLRIDDLQ